MLLRFVRARARAEAEPGRAPHIVANRVMWGVARVVVPRSPIGCERSGRPRARCALVLVSNFAPAL